MTKADETLGASGLARKIRIGDVVLDRMHHQLCVGIEVRTIEPRLVRLLDELCAVPGDPVSRDTLLSAVSNLPYAGDEALTQAISKLRQALGDDPKAPRYIKTIPRRGYALIAPVTPFEEAQLEMAPQRNKGLFWMVGGALLAGLLTWAYFEFVALREIEIEFTEQGDQEFIEKKDMEPTP
ncbi:MULTISPECIES: winged helix-turn-helix domain-containing protein [Kordiimonas]|uniref:winged helix-turn-helix domain-containing protein n=1 Tax=Kordiimonas TaxID=288021 RepID=UPI00257FC4C0|nr:winged helix-turn-helix domain-containing protein [Kordiimonas sp. UBA4487]